MEQLESQIAELKEKVSALENEKVEIRKELNRVNNEYYSCKSENSKLEKRMDILMETNLAIAKAFGG